MISRRNIRVKVMQTLYSLELHEDSTQQGGAAQVDVLPKSKRLLQQHLDQTSRIFTYLLFTITEVAKYVETDARQRASKRLPTLDDLHVNTQLAANHLVLRLMDDPVFLKMVDGGNFKLLSNPEIIKKIFLQLAQSSAYSSYLETPLKNEKEDRNILLYLFGELLLKSEAFDQHMEDLFLHWPDDREMMNILVNNYLNKPASFDFRHLVSEEKETYGYDLLRTVIEKKAYCLELIRPRLQNWDPDRIAAIDMMLMNMGICEFLYFPTIPTKVTINEYIDLAKTYSTPQSGQFVNGILDNVLKDLVEAQKVLKTDRIRK